MTAITAAMVKQLRDQTGVGIMACKQALIVAKGDVALALEELKKAGSLSAAKKAIRRATEGRVAMAISHGHDIGVVLEVNCETDFVANDPQFVQWVTSIAEVWLQQPSASIEEMRDQLEEVRLSMVAKTGENIQIRRAKIFRGGVIHGYVHGHKIGVLVQAKSAPIALLRDVSMHIAATAPDYLYEEEIDRKTLAHEQALQLEAVQRSGNKPKEIMEKIAQGRMQKWMEEVVLTKQLFVKREAGTTETVGDLLHKHGVRLQSFVRLQLGEGVAVEEKTHFSEEVASIVASHQPKKDEC